MRFFLRREEGKAGEEDKRGPSLTDIAGHLGERQAGIGVGTEAASEELDRARRRIGDRLRIARGRWRRRIHCDLVGRVSSREGHEMWRQNQRLGRTLRECALHAGGSVGFHRNLARLRLYS